MAAVVVVAAQPTASPKGEAYGIYSHFNPAMAMVVIVLVCAFFIVGFISVYIRHCTEYNATANAAVRAAAPAGERSGREGLDPAVIESFPVFMYSYVKELKIGKGDLECAICLSEFEDEETLRLIPKCSHVFHPDCIEAWLEYHVTCPVCRANLTPEPDSKPVESIPTATESNSNNNDSSSPPTTEEQNTEFVINVNEEPRPREKITGKFPRSHSTGHSLVCAGENVERYTLRLPEEIMKQIMKSGQLKRTRSYTVGRKGGDGSSRGRSYIDRWMFSRTPPFVTKMVSVKPDKGGEGEGDASNSWRGLTSVKGKLSWLNLKVEQVDKDELSARPPV